MNTSKNQTTWKLRNQRKRNYRKFISLLLALIMLLGVPLGTDLGITEVEASNIIDSGTWGSNITWEFDGSTLTFHGSGVMQDTPKKVNGPTVTFSIAWIRHRDAIQKVVISEGITKIGEFNFHSYCTNLKTVILPESLNSIGEYAFNRCSKLQTVNLPKNLNSIGESSFGKCEQLSNITIPNSVTKIGESAFFGCNKFTRIIIPSNVKTINDAFSGCHNLTSVKISNGVTKIGNEAFAECSKLKSIDIPASVTSIGFRAFDDCNKLASIKIRNRNCKISMINELTIPKKTTIYGYKNSPAHKYAKKFGNKFKTLSSSSSASSKTVKTKSLKITNSPKTLKAGKSKTLKVKFTPSNVSSKKVTWKSSNKNYATVNSKGKVTAKKAGRGKTVKITATAKDGSKKEGNRKDKNFVKCFSRTK